VRDNLIFGRIVTRHGRANERLRELITWVADDGGFRERIVAAGLDYAVGIGGAHLTPQQRQKLVLAAALLKSEAARLLIAHAPTGDLERSAARRILQQLLEAYRERTVICALDDPGLAELLGRTVTLSAGQVIEDGASTESEAAPARAATG
jgi:ABC-type transport system involved in cytochrome bd biosynthesis fused ATPase/permease subunit